MGDDSTFIRYQVVSRTGRGSVAEVFRATDAVSQSTVALKVLRGDRVQDAVRGSLRREYQILRSINEPALPRVIGYRHTRDQRPLIIMEWIEGHSLDHVTRPLPWCRETLGALFGLFSAVESLHKRGWVHLDIKPANVVLQVPTLDGEPQSRVRLLDAGLMARVGDIIKPRGSPGYLAPELLDSEPSWDCRSDLFSLGSVCHRLLTGTEAFRGSSAGEVIRASARGERDSLHMSRPDLPPPFIELVETLFSLNPDARPASVSNAIRVLERISELEGWQPPDRHELAWESPDCLPWPPIPRPEGQAIVDFVTAGGPPRLRLVEVQASAGLGRESFARDLADSIAFAGFPVEAVVGPHGLIGSPAGADSLWMAVLSGQDDAKAVEPTGGRGIGKLADALWRSPITLIWDLGATAPVWLGKWIDELGLSLASVSARERDGGEIPPSVIVLFGSKPTATIEREILIPSLEVALSPVEDGDLEPYVAAQLSLSVGSHRALTLDDDSERTTNSNSASRIVQSSQGYPEIVGMLLDQAARARTGDSVDNREYRQEDPYQTLIAILSARSMSLSHQAAEALRVLECTTTPLEPEILCKALSCDKDQVSHTLLELEVQRLVFHGGAGLEITYRDLLSKGYRLADPPTPELHQRIANALSCKAREGTSERWLARARHLFESGGSGAERVTLIAALHLYRRARLEEAARFLDEWRRARYPRDASDRGLWCLRLLLQTVWESRDHARFAYLRGMLPFDDPIVVAMEARILRAKGQPNRSLELISNINTEGLVSPSKVFLLTARAFALRETEGSERFCSEAKSIAALLPSRGYSGLKSLLLQRWAQEALWCGDVDGAEEAVRLLEGFSRQEKDSLLQIGTLLSQGFLAFHRADLEAGRMLAQAALEIARGAGYTNQAYVILSHLGGIAFEAGRWEEAIGANREILEIEELTKSYSGKSNTLRNLCLIRRVQALYEVAITHGEEAVELAREFGSEVDRLSSAGMLAYCLVSVGRREDAWSILEEARESIADAEPGLFRAAAIEAMAHSAPIPPSLGTRELEPTLALDAYSADFEAGLKDNAAELALEVAWDALRADSIEEAQEWVDRSASFPKGKVPRIDIWRALVNGRLVAAKDAWDTSEGRAAWKDMEEAIKLARKWGFYELLWRLGYIRAHGLVMLGHQDEAMEELRRAKSTMDRIVDAMKEERHRNGYLSRPDQARFLRLLEALESR